jgi:hypothetical protein
LRLSSAVCDTEVIVIKAPHDDLDLRCGGRPMVEHQATAAARSGVPAAPFDAGTLIGKRYAADGPAVEVLCTRAGEGSLSIGEVVLPPKEASPLPSSD